MQYFLLLPRQPTAQKTLLPKTIKTDCAMPDEGATVCNWPPLFLYLSVRRADWSVCGLRRKWNSSTAFVLWMCCSVLWLHTQLDHTVWENGRHQPYREWDLTGALPAVALFFGFGSSVWNLFPEEETLNIFCRSPHPAKEGSIRCCKTNVLCFLKRNRSSSGHERISCPSGMFFIICEVKNIFTEWLLM